MNRRQRKVELHRRKRLAKAKAVRDATPPQPRDGHPVKYSSQALPTS